MDNAAPKGSFGRHRKIMPFEPGSIEAQRDASRQKAARLNQHVLGYGALAEAEWQAAGIAAPDLPAMRKYRLERIRAELKRRDYAGALLYDPVNIRYAADSTNMQLWVAQPEATRHAAPAFEHHAELPQLDVPGGTATVLVGATPRVTRHGCASRSA